MAYKRDIRSKWASDEKRRTEAANITPGRFGGTTFTTGAEIDRENVQRRSLETLTAKGEQDRLSQDNAASIAQSRKNQLDVDAINSEQAGPSMAEQRKEFMAMYAELDKAPVDADGLPILDNEGNPMPRPDRAQILQTIRDRSLAFEQSQKRGGPASGRAIIQRAGGDQTVTSPSGAKETSTALSRATSKMSESFSDEEELRKLGPASTPISVTRPPITASRPVSDRPGIGNKLFSKIPDGETLNKRLVPTRDIYSSFMKRFGTPMGDRLTSSVKRRQKSQVFNSGGVR